MQRRGLALVALVAFIAVGCGSPDQDPVDLNAPPNSAPNNGTPNNGEPNNADEGPLGGRDQAIIASFSIPKEAEEVASVSLDLTLEAVVGVSVGANGGAALELSGTLTQSGAGFTYSAGPADRIVIAWIEGPPTELYVEQLQGDLEAESATAFYRRNHAVTARVVREGVVDVTVTSTKNGTERYGGVSGSIVSENVTFEVNLEEVEKAAADIDTSTGTEYESDSALAGTVTAPGYSLVVNEESRYRMIYVDNFVESRWRTANNKWTYQGADYALVEGYVRGTYRDSYPHEFEYWRASGVLTENGAAIGEIGFERDEFHLSVVLALTNGEKITLQKEMLRP